jgi:hypothetical protein
MIMQPMLPLGDLNVATCTMGAGGVGVGVLDVLVVVLEGTAVVLAGDAVATAWVDEVADVVTVTVAVRDEPQPRTVRASPAAARDVARAIMCAA